MFPLQLGIFDFGASLEDPHKSRYNSDTLARGDAGHACPPPRTHKVLQDFYLLPECHMDGDLLSKA